MTSSATPERLSLKKSSPLILECPDSKLAARLRTLLRGLPPLSGAPIRVEASPGLHDRYGEVHAGSFLRERRIALNCTRAEFRRIVIHELFHFVWLRLGNPLRQSYEALLRAERANGELGWSAEWRRQRLRRADRRLRSRRWREYCCESFCDTAAWLYAGVEQHAEFTLAGRHRRDRRVWFRQALGKRELPV